MINPVKRIYSLLIISLWFCLTQNVASAQINDYLLHNPIWRDSSTCAVPHPCIRYEGYNFYVNGDTTWNGLVYKKIFRKGAGEYVWFSPTPPQCSGTYSYVETEPSFILRSFGKQMFIKIQSELTEQLLYDFDLDVGDTLPNTYNNLPGNIIYVTAIDSFYTPYGYRKIFTLAGANWAQYLIEGVGSSHGLIEPLGNFFDCGYQLLCYSLNDTSWYPAQRISCNIPLGVEEVFDMKPLKVSPNPFMNECTVSTEHPFRNAHLRITNALGEVVESRSGINGNSIIIRKDVLKPGVYWVNIIEADASSYIKVILAGK